MKEEHKKDIFIDTNIAKNFSNPLSESYKSLVRWFMKGDGCLVVSQKIITEYHKGNIGATSATNIAMIINILTREGRLHHIKKSALDSLQFSKAEEKTLTCNHADYIHLKTVFLSNRKLAISNDNKFRGDINGFRKVDKKQPFAVAKPDDVDYRNYR